MVVDISKEDIAKQAVLNRLRSNIPAGMGNLTRLISTLKSPVKLIDKEKANA